MSKIKHPGRLLRMLRNGSLERQDEFAKSADISPQHMAGIEMGRRSLNLEVIRRLRKRGKITRDGAKGLVASCIEEALAREGKSHYNLFMDVRLVGPRFQHDLEQLMLRYVLEDSDV